MFGFFPGIGAGNALIAPAGTSIPMAQASAPPGWNSQSVTDTSLRYNSGTGGGTGGSTNWSSWNGGGTFNVNSFTLSVAQLASHTHSDAGHNHGASSPAHQHDDGLGGGGFMIGNSPVSSTGGFTLQGLGSGGYANTSSTGVTGFVAVTVNIATGNANIQANGSGAAIQPNYTTPSVKFVDHILAVKL